MTDITKNEIYTVSNFGHKYIAISGINKPEKTDNIEVDYKYISPLTALVVSVDPSIRETAVGEVRLGDVLITIDPAIRVGKMDRFTLTKQEEKESEILTRGQKDVLRYTEIFQISEVISLGDDGATLTRYEEGTDFVLSGREIIWLDNGNQPIDGRQYTVTYWFRPLYRVFNEFPLVRTPGNILMRIIARRDDVW